VSPADLPPQLHESVSCSVAAAASYGVPTNILLAVVEKETGAPGLWVQNRNGTRDVGPMQFNTAYLATLSKYGITPQAVAGDIWTRAANYHSRTPRYNARYRLDLMAKSVRWADWLERCASGSCPRMSIPSLHKPVAARSPALLQSKQATAPLAYLPRTITASLAP
jgi:hypothetical protein